MNAEHRAEYDALLAKIEKDKAFERRLVDRCKALMAPVLDVSNFDVRITLYPKQRRERYAGGAPGPSTLAADISASAPASRRGGPAPIL